MPHEQPISGRVFEDFVRLLAGVAQHFTSDETIPFDQLPPKLQGHVRFIARAAINSCDKRRIADAELRARQQLALLKYRREFHLLNPSEKRAVYFQAHECCTAYQRSLEGIMGPLHPDERAELLVKGEQ